jgi:hypothetical protein
MMMTPHKAHGAAAMPMLTISARSLAPLGLLVLLWAPMASAAGVLQFVEPRLDLREGETRDITVIRSGSASGEVTVTLSVGLGGTAVLGEDYTVELPLGVIRIPDGRLFGRARLNALHDDRVEGTKYAVFTLANPTGATLARENSLLLQIEDVDTAQAEFGFAGDPVLRVTAGEELPVEVTRSGLDGETLSVVIFAVPDTAALGIDFSDLTTTLEFGPGSGSETATLSTLARAEPGPPRSLSLMLAHPAPAGQAAFAGLGPVVIIEDPPTDRAGEFSLFAAAGQVREDDGSIVFTVDRNRGSAGAASVSWVTIDGEGSNAAVAGTDYVASTGTLEFAAGETRKTFEVDLIATDTVRPRRHFEVALANPSGQAGLDPEGRRVAITIRADEGEPEDDCRGFCDCFIATAAWGSWMDPHVQILRRFRDEVLLPYAPGRWLVAVYYRYSPPLAEWIGHHESLRAMTRAVLAPVVFAVQRPLLTAALLLTGLLLPLNLRRRWRRIHSA